MLPFNGTNPRRRAINENHSCTRKCLARCKNSGLIIVRPNRMKRLLVTILIVVAVLVAALGLAIALGGPGKAPPPMSSINDPSRTWISPIYRKRGKLRLAMALSSPFGPTRQQEARSKAALAICTARLPSSSSMHLMAKGFAAAGYAAYTLDIRGHGKSGAKGHIAYIGQLEDDLEDLSIRPNSLSLPRSPDSLPAADSCFASRAVHVKVTILQRSSFSPWISQDASNVASGQRRLGTVGVPNQIDEANDRLGEITPGCLRRDALPWLISISLGLAQAHTLQENSCLTTSNSE